MKFKGITWRGADFSHFLQAQSHLKLPGLILKVSPLLYHSSSISVNLTVSRRSGNAVRRNRIRRRLRAILTSVLPQRLDYNLVIISQAETFDYPYISLYIEFKAALQELSYVILAKHS